MLLKVESISCRFINKNVISYTSASCACHVKDVRNNIIILSTPASSVDPVLSALALNSLSTLVGRSPRAILVPNILQNRIKILIVQYKTVSPLI